MLHPIMNPIRVSYIMLHPMMNPIRVNVAMTKEIDRGLRLLTQKEKQYKK
jgi:hypothetical protein